MSIIHRKYYQWDDSKSDFKIKLGMEKSHLLDNGTIKEVIVNEEICYEGKNGFPWRVEFKHDKVEKVWYNSNHHIELKGLDITEIEMKTGVDFLNTHFKEIPELNNENISLKEYRKSDILHIIYRDFFLCLLVTIKKNEHNYS